MKFEYVGFYPITDKNRGMCGKNIVGTLHIYVIDCKLDIRGIKVSKNGKTYFFSMPFVKTLDPDTGESCTFPVVSWDPITQKEMVTWLHSEVKPKIIKELQELKHPVTRFSRLSEAYTPPSNSKVAGYAKIF